MKINLSLARLSDIAEVLQLHHKYQVDTISEDDRPDGFITTAFSKQHLHDLITQEAGLFIARHQGRIVAYAMAGSWSYFSQWPMFKHMIKGLPSLQYAGTILSTQNCYQYGPVCVDKSMRGSGVFEKIFHFSLQKMSQRFPIMVTFINKINPRSFEAHVRKVGLDVIQEFEFNNNQYYELACCTQPALKAINE